MNIINTTFCIVKKREFRDAASEGVLSNLKDRQPLILIGRPLHCCGYRDIALALILTYNISNN